MTSLHLITQRKVLFAVLILFCLAAALSTFTAEAKPVLKGPGNALPVLKGTGTANIDGVFAPGEWSSADTLHFSINGQYNTLYYMTLYVMNDGENLYFALVHQGNPQGLYWTESANITLDKNQSKVIDVGDDSWNLINEYFPPTASRVETFTDSYINSCTVGCNTQPDTFFQGTNEGTGAIANDGSQTVYEFSHPLATANDDHDIILQSHDSPVVSGKVRIKASPSQVYASGSIPAFIVKIAK